MYPVSSAQDQDKDNFIAKWPLTWHNQDILKCGKTPTHTIYVLIQVS